MDSTTMTADISASGVPQRSLLQRLRLWPPRRAIVSVVDLNGPILRGKKGGVCLDTLNGPLERAFRPRRLTAVALKINSTGGSPAQAAMIHRRIRSLARLRRVPVLAFVEEYATSAGYWIALAADEIYAEETSIVGSIGVVSTAFGFAKILQKLGVERRVHSSVAEKGLNDPYLPENPRGVELLRNIQDDFHECFRETVVRRRGARLSSEHALQGMSGAAFSGRRALSMGLLDGIGDMQSILAARLRMPIKMRVHKPRRQRFSFAQLGSSLSQAAEVVSEAHELMAALKGDRISSHYDEYR